VSEKLSIPEATLKACGHWCSATLCDALRRGNKCHCGGCAVEAVRRKLTLSPGNGFGYASR